MGPANSNSAAFLAWSGMVVGVNYDDTIEVMRAHRQVKIRLYGIDCPEKGQPFSKEAKEFTSDMVFGKIVEAEGWDEEKSKRNLDKHGITFDEAKTVFNDPFAITIADPHHSDEEERCLDIGLSIKQRLLVLWYTDRDENIRIIGCRKATSFERKTY